MIDDNIVEITDVGEDVLDAEISTGRKLIEGSQMIKGFVSVVITRADGTEEVLCHNKPNLLTNSGRDDFHTGLYTNAGASQTPFNFIGLTTDVGAPSATDTDLTGEITTGGLSRIQAASRVHTGGTNTSTLIQTFTATAVHTALVKAGLFDVIGPPVAGTMGHESTFTTATLQISDQITITWVLTVG